MTYATVTKSLKASLHLAGILGAKLRGGEAIELVGDLGAGKTIFVRGLAKGMGSKDQVQSPSFTIERVYRGRDKRELHHFDFHRLNEPGIIKQSLAEVLGQPHAAVAIEWSDVVKDVLPAERLRVIIKAVGKEQRHFNFEATGKQHQQLLEAISK